MNIWNRMIDKDKFFSGGGGGGGAIFFICQDTIIILNRVGEIHTL